MKNLPQDSIPSLLTKNIPRDLVLAVEDALFAGAKKAYNSVQDVERGHRNSALGQMRHFQMNQAFHLALKLGGASPTLLRANEIVKGQTGIFTLGRFNIRNGFWENGRRSKTRRKLSELNKIISRVVMPDMFSDYEIPAEAIVFFVACFPAGNCDAPGSIELAVPDQDMHGWLFREPLNVFLKRYDEMPTSNQQDLALPKLKKFPKKQSGDEAV